MSGETYVVNKMGPKVTTMWLRNQYGSMCSLSDPVTGDARMRLKPVDFSDVDEPASLGALPKAAHIISAYLCEQCCIYIYVIYTYMYITYNLLYA